MRGRAEEEEEILDLILITHNNQQFYTGIPTEMILLFIILPPTKNVWICFTILY